MEYYEVNQTTQPYRGPPQYIAVLTTICELTFPEQGTLSTLSTTVRDDLFNVVHVA